MIGAQLIEFFAHLFYALHLPKAGMNRDQQQLEIDWLGQVRVRSFLQAHQNIFPAAQRGKEYEWHFGEQDVFFTYLLQQFVTVFRRHVDVTEHEIGLVFEDHLKAFTATTGFKDLIVSLLQLFDDILADIFVVFDTQNLGHGVRCFSRGFSRGLIQSESSIL